MKRLSLLLLVGLLIVFSSQPAYCWSRQYKALVHIHDPFSDGFVPYQQLAEELNSLGYQIMVATPHLEQINSTDKAGYKYTNYKLVGVKQYLEVCDQITANGKILVLPGAEIATPWSREGDQSVAHTLVLSIRPLIEAGFISFTGPNPNQKWDLNTNGRIELGEVHQVLRRCNLPVLAAHPYSTTVGQASLTPWELSDYRYDPGLLMDIDGFGLFYPGSNHESLDENLLIQKLTNLRQDPSRHLTLYSDCDYHLGPQSEPFSYTTYVVASSQIPYLEGKAIPLRLDVLAEARKAEEAVIEAFRLGRTAAGRLGVKIDSGQLFLGGCPTRRQYVGSEVVRITCNNQFHQGQKALVMMRDGEFLETTFRSVEAGKEEVFLDDFFELRLIRQTDWHIYNLVVRDASTGQLLYVTSPNRVEVVDEPVFLHRDYFPPDNSQIGSCSGAGSCLFHPDLEKWCQQADNLFYPSYQGRFSKGELSPSDKICVCFIIYPAPEQPGRLEITLNSPDGKLVKSIQRQTRHSPGPWLLDYEPLINIGDAQTGVYQGSWSYQGTTSGGSGLIGFTILP